MATRAVTGATDLVRGNLNATVADFGFGRLELGLQLGLCHGCNVRPVQTARCGQANVFGDNAFGDIEGSGRALKRVAKFEFVAECFFDHAHLHLLGRHLGSW